MANSGIGKHGRRVGDAVEVEWQGVWFPAEVLEVLKNGDVKIHYTGWNSSWDETVPPARVRLPGSVPTAMGTPSVTMSNPTGAGGAAPPVSFDAIKHLLLDEPVTDKTPLEPGDAVLAEWGGTYWEARVVELQKKNVKINYVGWDSTWDETVTRSRLRLRSHDVKRLRVYFDCDWMIEGALIESAAGFITLQRISEGQLVVVNLARVVFLERIA